MHYHHIELLGFDYTYVFTKYRTSLLKISYDKSKVYIIHINIYFKANDIPTLFGGKSTDDCMTNYQL